jgi:single-stranded-DNA-specific exonuclease
MKTLTPQTIEDFLISRTKDDICKTLRDLPQPDSFKDIKKASKRIIKAIKTDETITIVGDYDVDGVVSTAIMIEFFKILKIDLNYIIPNRFTHGYGLSPKLIENISSGLIITVDNGVSAFEASKLCKAKNIDLIITDHHTVGDKLPEAFAIVNPKQTDCSFPFKDICGAQVAWYLCAMIKKELKLNIDMLKFFDILSLAIIADIMPMRSLNSTMVKKGLKNLQNSIRPSILAIKNRFLLETINEEDIGFKIAPLINCAGRLEDAMIALEFLLSPNIAEANNNLDYLIQLNEQRKVQQLQIYEDAKCKINQNDEVVFVFDKNYNEGIIGIIASKLSEKYKKPAFVFSIKNNIAKGSARSDDVDLFNLILKCSDSLIGFGGHKGAAGMSLDIKNLDNFKQLLNIQTKELKKTSTNNNTNTALGVLDISYINKNLYDTIDSFRPFGLENKMPSFIFSNSKILELIKIGKNKEFTKLIISNGFYNIEVVIFTDFEDVKVGQNINFEATISKNEFRNNIKYNLLFKRLV